MDHANSPVHRICCPELTGLSRGTKVKITHTKYEIPVWPELNMFSAYPEIVSGHMVLPETPGLGLRAGRRSRGTAVGGEGQTTPDVG